MAMTNRLRVLRAEREITQWDLSVKTGIERNRYWTIEKGYTTPRPEERVALAAALGVTEAEIWPELESAEVPSTDVPAQRIA